MNNAELHVTVAAVTEALRAESRQPAEPDTVLTIEEAAEWLGVSRSLIYTLMGTGELSSIKIGRRRFIPVVEAERLIRGEAA
ncbi:MULTISPECIES: helix-turn-helix domain-containing protein [Mycobacteriaceae]|nr:MULTISPECIES: helix-turn-helix domain-containing protein [Mycobacteriaceae]MBP2451735.1 excisionase family DNA binding protein [Mycolicibacterium lutetiense]UBV13106.1 helix-turn-helix domain-containing protein [Mycolicibacterium fortuitum]